MCTSLSNPPCQTIPDLGSAAVFRAFSRTAYAAVICTGVIKLKVMHQAARFGIAVLLAALVVAAGCASGGGGDSAATVPPVSEQPSEASSTAVPEVSSTTVPAESEPLSEASSTTAPAVSSTTVPPFAASVVQFSTEYFAGSFMFDGSKYEVELAPVKLSLPEDRRYSYSSGDGRSVLELRGAAGEVLRRVRLYGGYERENDDGTVEGYFSGLVMDPPEYASFAVFRGADEMLVLERSANAPTAELTGVSEGQRFSLTDTIELDLGGADADGDELVYNVYVDYSAKPYTGFELLESDWTEPVFSLPVARLEESDFARFGVSVSDGLRPVFVVSPTFRLPRRPPEIWIADVPEGGFRFLDEQTVHLVAHLYYREGTSEELESELEVVWESDIDGVIEPFFKYFGDGYTSASLNVEDLSEGDHTLTVTATDSEGRSGSHSVPMQVLHDSYQPPRFEAYADFASVRVGETVYVDVTSNDVYELELGGVDLFDDIPPSLGEAEVVQHPEFGIPLIKYTAHTEGEERFGYVACSSSYCELAQVYVTVEPALPAGS